MKKTEIYIYSRNELEKNKVVMAENGINDIKYQTENTIGNLYLPNSMIKVGKINYINNLVISNENSFNTSIGTLVTNDGSLVFNFNYILKFFDSKPEVNKIFYAKPTFVSGKYLHYENISISVQILELNGDRIVAIDYD